MVRRGLLIAVSTISLLALPAAPAHAAVIAVNTNAEAAADGMCALREAIAAANNDAGEEACPAGSGTDTITIPADTYLLSMGQLVAESDLTLSGAGAATTIIDANDTSRILKVADGATVTVSDLTIQDGTAQDSDGSGADSRLGGGIINRGTLTLVNSIITGNSATASGDFAQADGGGIWSNGPLTIMNSTVSSNTVSASGLLASASAGGIASINSTLNVSGSTITGNSAEDGGGGLTSFGSLSITGSTISSNTGGTTGGGISRGCCSGTSATITGSTITLNTAVSGAGIHTQESMTLTSTDVTSNAATGNAGGIQNFGSLTITGGTLAMNQAGVAGTGGNLLNGFGATSTVSGTGITGGDAFSGGGIWNQGSLTLLDTTVDDNDTATAGGGIRNLGPLTIDGGTVSGNTSGGPGAGIHNNDDLTLDGTTVNANVMNGSGFSLGGGISNGNAGTVDATDSHIDGNQGRGIDNGGVLLLTNSTVNDNVLSPMGDDVGGIQNVGSATIVGGEVSGNDGQGIYTSGSLTINGTTIGQNTATDIGDGPVWGGGIATFGTGSPTTQVTGGLIQGNTADGGAGGVMNAAAGGTFTVTETTVTGNVAPRGGGLQNEGTMTIVRSTITGNSATANEGGGLQNSGALSLENTTVSGNDATGNGAGIMSFGGTVTLDSSTVTANTSSTGTGGLQGGTFVLARTIVAGNTGPTGPDCFGPLTSQGHNLIGNVDPPCAIGGDTSGNLVGDPMLGTLSDNGGATFTHRLLSGSPAIDTGGTTCPVTDQRGVKRPQGPACDIGAFETTPPSSSIAFPGSGGLYNAASFVAGCASAVPDVCGAATANPSGAAPASVQVRLRRASDGRYWDGDSWEIGETWNPAAGTTAWTYALTPAEGTYTLSSRATDADGYVESTATAAFTIDDTAPETKITKKPKKKVRTARKKKRVRFAFEASEEGVTFLCKLDGRPWKPCDSPFRKRLKPGKHRFRARATDVAGNVEATPARWRFRILEA